MNTNLKAHFRTIPLGQVSRLTRALVVLIGLIWLPLIARAQTTETIATFKLRDGYGADLAGDANLVDSDPNRRGINVSSTVHSVNSGSSSVTDQYTLHYTLLDASAAPVALNIAGSPSFYLETPISITVGGNSFLDHDQADRLQPFARLDPYQQYTVKLTLYRGGSPIPATAAATIAPRNYYHFTNLVSGDLSSNVIATLDSAAFVRISAARNLAGKACFTANLSTTLRRFDDFNATAGVSASIPVAFSYQLIDDLSHTVALKSNHTNFLDSVANYAVVSSIKQPVVAHPVHTLQVEPSDTEQLDVNRTYNLQVTISHTDEIDLPDVAGNTISAPPQKLFHFNRNLLFGPVATRFNSLLEYPDQTLVPTIPATKNYAVASLKVDANSGYVVSNPSATYGDGSALSVWLLANGDATNASLSPVTMNSPSPDRTANVRFERVGATLDNNGAHSQIQLDLPGGLGYTSDPSSHVLQRKILFASVLNLPANLVPTTPMSYSPGSFWICEDSKPLLLGVTSLTYDPVAGQLSFTATGSTRYARQNEYAQLDADASTLLNPHGATKRSNEKYFRAVNQVTTSPILVYADASGRALMNYNLNFASTPPVSFSTHFPYDTAITWGGAATMDIVNNLVQNPTANASQAPGVSSILISYSPKCPGCSDPISPFSLNFTPQGSVLPFTLDGGLDAAGVVPSSSVQWGHLSSGPYAQQVSGVQNVSLHIPGGFLAGGQTSLAMEDLAGALLYTGATNSSPGTPLERPDAGGTANQAAYLAGAGDYAGLNFSAARNSLTPVSTIAKMPFAGYGLTSRSKYYLRPAGVSGIHEANSASFPRPLVLYGYDFVFTRYGLAYLDSENPDSRTDGSVSVKFPSDFTQPFTSLKFDCLGGLLSASVPANDTAKVLGPAYWRGDFSTLAIAFERNATDVCDPGKGFLVLGVQAHSTPLAEVLYGQLGFISNGCLINLDYGLTGVDSRLNLPNQSHLSSAITNQPYVFNPVCGAYFNNYSNFVAGPGWMDLAGKLDVPFFEDLKVHLHTNAKTNDATLGPEDLSSTMYTMGCATKLSDGSDQSWSINGQNYFSAPYFDTANAGYPFHDATPDKYRNWPFDDTYHPRGQRTWLRVVHFDYPLSWDTLGRSFASTHEITNDLLVITAKHHVESMDARTAAIDFGVKYDGAPMASMAKLSFDELDKATGMSKALDDAVGKGVRKAILAAGDSLNDLLADTLAPIVDPVFDRKIDPIITSLYTNLQSVYTANPNHNWLPDAKEIIEGYVSGTGAKAVDNNILTNLIQLVGKTTNDLAMAKEIADKLDTVSSGISNFQFYIIKNPSGHYTNLENQLANISTDTPLIGGYTAKVKTKAEALLAKSGNTLDRLFKISTQLSNRVYQVHSVLTNADGLATQITDILTNSASQDELTDLCTEVSDESYGWFTNLDYAIDNPFHHYSQAEVTKRIRRSIEDRFMASVASDKIVDLFKEHVYDFDEEFKKMGDTALQQVNSIVRELITGAVTNLDDSKTSFLGGLSKVGGTAKVEGYAHINGDALKELRLDIDASLNVDSDSEFQAYLEIKQLQSSGSPGGCDTAADNATEVTIGAKDVSLNWVAKDLKADIEGKFAFKSDPFKLVELGASFATTGEIKLDDVKITKLAAGVAFGEIENYVSASVALTYKDYSGAGGIFFGKACTLAPILLWDPDFETLLGVSTDQVPFKGIYAFADVSFPLNPVFGIPDTCALRLNADAGVGLGYKDPKEFFGKMKLGLDGEVICCVDVQGDITLYGSSTGKFHGAGSVSGTAFGKTLTKSFTLP